MSFDPRPSPWGYNWTPVQTTQQQQAVRRAEPRSPSPDSQQLANLPAALLSTLKREKKPFTYTPGGVNLSEVLEARLQKRMERKKRYCEEKMNTPPPRQVVVMPTYNTPLDMYSMQNALEVLEVQAGLAASQNSPSSPPPRSATLPRNHTFRFEDPAPERGVAQSKAFRVLQIMTDTEEDAAACRHAPRHNEEERFTSLRDSGSIPSRFFHALQKITGTDEEMRTSPPHGVVHQHRASPPRHQHRASPPRHQHRASPPRHQHQASPGYLRRPAAFLPSKAASTSAPAGFRPVRAPRADGANPFAAAGTDF